MTTTYTQDGLHLEPEKGRTGVSGHPELMEFDGEARLLDEVLASKLGYGRERSIRDLIKRHRGSLEAMGILPQVAANSPGRGRPSQAFYLNQAQAVFLVAKANTGIANIELVRISQIFTEYAEGNLKPADASTAGRLAEYDRQRLEARQRHLEDRQARTDAFALMGSGRKKRRRRALPEAGY